MRFSIVVPVYNVAPYLRDCLDSVMAQTFADWEAICVDDGSFDGSGAILDEYADRDKRFKVIHQANLGVSAARNAALRIAQGEYVGFADGDDILQKGWLAAVCGLIEKTDADIIRMRCTRWRDDTPMPTVLTDERYILFDSDEKAKEYGWAIIPVGGWTWLHFFKRTRVADIFFPEAMGNCEDVIFGLKVLKNARSFCQGEFPGYIYRLRKGSICRSPRKFKDVSMLISELTELNSQLDGGHELKALAARNCSLAFWSSLMCWQTRNDSLDVKSDFRRIIRLLKISATKGVFSWRMGNRWSFCAWLTLVSQSMLPIIISRKLFSTLSWIKRSIT